LVSKKNTIINNKLIIGIFFLLAGISLSGCVIIPTPAHGGKGVVSAEVVQSFILGKTTRAEVLLQLGSPNYRFDQDRFIAYDWTQIVGYWGAGGQGGGDAGGIKDYRILCMEFSQDNRLKKYKFFSQRWFKGAAELMYEWIQEQKQNEPTLPEPITNKST